MLTSLASSSYWESSKIHTQREGGAKDVNYSWALTIYIIIYGPWYNSWSNSIGRMIYIEVTLGYEQYLEHSFE